MTFISTLGQSLAQGQRLSTLQLQLSTLQAQLSSGKKTNLFKGLGTDVIASERARADLSELEAYDHNITVADRRLQIMINVVQETKQQAANVVNAIQIQTQQGEFELESVGDLAKKVKDFVVNLMNEKDGDRFLFSGSGTRNQPLSDTGTLDTYLQTQINDWVNTTIDTDTLVDSYRDTGTLNDTLVGYSAQLTIGNVKDVHVRADEGLEIDYTVLANDAGFRDILVATSMLENMANSLDEVTLDPDDPVTTVTAPGADKSEQNNNFYQMFNDLAAMLNGALDRMEKLESDLSQTEAQILQIQENHKLEKNILENTISDIENIDITQIAVELNSLQVQMQASYSIAASVKDLSLVNFL